MTCPTCGADPCINPGFCASCRDTDRRRARGERPRYFEQWRDWPADIPRDWDTLSLDALYRALNDPRRRPTPETTIKAIMYCVRERGLAALKEPANIERLSRCDAAARAQIDQRIAKLKKAGQ
jgi:hypothetical protein